MATVTAIAVGTLGFVAYQLGMFDWAEFEEGESLVGRECTLVVACSRDKNIGKRIVDLFRGVQKGLLSLDDGADMMKQGAKLYPSPEGAQQVSVGLYFDNPHVAENPRWATGWMVAGKTHEEVEAMVELIQEASGLQEPIRAVRVGTDGILKARFPWRNSLTPMIAPMLHWKRAWKAYKDGGYSAVKTAEGRDGSIAMELYLTGKEESFEYIDYVVLFGDTTATWVDCFPPS